MAFGIDDALGAAASGLNLTNTLVETVRACREKGVSIDIEKLIEECRVEAIERINEADKALSQFERTLKEKGVNLDQSLDDVIRSTPFWEPFENRRLKRFRSNFNSLADATYDATDDIAALLRCRDQIGEMGVAVVESAKTKHNLHARLLESATVGESIAILREELLKHRESLST